MVCSRRPVRAVHDRANTICVLALASILAAGITLRLGAEPISTVRLDQRPFQLLWGAREDDTPGALKFGAYCNRGAALTKTHYRCRDSASGEATVEVVRHDLAYSYVVHDLYGFLQAASAHPSRMPPQPRQSEGSSKDVEGRIKLIDWPIKGGREGQQVWCVRNQDEQTGQGVVAWYSERAEQHTTVVIRYEDLPGIPVNVVNDYLAEYPSALATVQTQVQNWEANDLQKWMHVLRADDKSAHQLAWLHLQRYDRASFGLLEASSKRNEPEAYAEAVEQVIANIQAHIDEHPDLQVGADEANEDNPV